MEASTTIRKMMRSAECIIVPSYQRAYSWETPTKNSKRQTHTDVFLADLEEYSRSSGKTKVPYYFGHFLFEEKEEKFYIVDGQQRLTTIVIFLSVLFTKLRQTQELSDLQEECYEDIVRRKKNVRFNTVGYDNQLFQDYVINQTKKNTNGLETESARRIVQAFDYFTKVLANKDSEYLTCLLDVIVNAACTTHSVTHESEAIQMFIFQNSRGKKPSRLEVIKAQFMYHIHLHGGSNNQILIKEVTNRFEAIYKAISSISYKIDEDDVLTYTLHVFKNTLSDINTSEFIQQQLADKSSDGIAFVTDFSRELSVSFEHLKHFFDKDERDNYLIHSFVTLGGVSVVLPFILKAYRLNIGIEETSKLCQSLESLVLRDRLIGTRADIATRLNQVFIEFNETNKSIAGIVALINRMKTTTDWWWAYWRDEELQKVLQGGLNHSIAKFLLWKYENYLRSQKGKSGYLPIRYDAIELPELEHIAPTTEPTQKPHGYGDYDDSFIKKRLNCLGNYVLISKSHNASIGNVPFSQKYASYTFLEQQREIQQLVPQSGIWDKSLIKNRQRKIVDFIMSHF